MDVFLIKTPNRSKIEGFFDWSSNFINVDLQKFQEIFEKSHNTKFSFHDLEGFWENLFQLKLSLNKILISRKSELCHFIIKGST